jgi:uncharacterized protein
LLVIFDPNILISALLTPSGRARRAVELGIAGRFEYAVCPALTDEVERAAARRRIALRLPPGGAERFLADVRGGARQEPDPEVRRVSRDPKDDYLVALAESVGADHLVTGDKDLLELDDPPVRITSLQEFLKALEGDVSRHGIP